MALTDEQKIIIGVCVGVAGLVLVVIIVFICCMICLRDNRKRHHKDHSFIDRDVYYDKKPYMVYDKTPPPYYEPPLPPPPEVYYEHPRSLDAPRYYDSWGRRSEPPRMEKRYYSDNRWKGVYCQDPIVVPMSKPEVVYNDRPRAEQDVIYLKYIDDQALLPRTNYNRSTIYDPPLRRSRSFTDMRNSAYVGEWSRRPERLDQFNDGALRAGRDPFLWG